MRRPSPSAGPAPQRVRLPLHLGCGRLEGRQVCAGDQLDGRWVLATRMHARGQLYTVRVCYIMPLKSAARHCFNCSYHVLSAQQMPGERSGRPHGSHAFTGGTYIRESMAGSFGQMLGSFWVSARRGRGSQGGLAQPKSFPATGSGSVSARGGTAGVYCPFITRNTASLPPTCLRLQCLS